MVEEWIVPPGSVLEHDWCLCTLVQLQTSRVKQSYHDLDPVVHEISNVPWPADDMGLDLQKKHDT